MKIRLWIGAVAAAFAVGVLAPSSTFALDCKYQDPSVQTACTSNINTYDFEFSGSQATESDANWAVVTCTFDSYLNLWTDTNNSSNGSSRKTTASSGDCMNRYLVCYEKTANSPKKCNDLPKDPGANDYTKCTNLVAGCDTSTGCASAATFQEDCAACLTAYGDSSGTCSTSTLVNACWSAVDSLALATTGLTSATCTSGAADSTNWACNCTTSGCDYTCDGTWGKTSAKAKKSKLAKSNS